MPTLITDIYVKELIRQYNFDVIFPPELPSGGELTKHVRMVDIPGESVTLGDSYPFSANMDIQLPDKIEFGNSFNIEFNEYEGNEVNNFLIAWANLIRDPVTRNFHLPINYRKPIRINVLSVEQATLYEIVLLRCFPVSFFRRNLDYSNSNGMTIEAQFAYSGIELTGGAGNTGGSSTTGGITRPTGLPSTGGVRTPPINPV